MKRRNYQDILKFIAVQIILAVVISVFLSPSISNWICKKKLNTTFVGTVRDKMQIDSTIQNAKIIVESIDETNTNESGVFTIKDIVTKRSRYAFLGCQSCSEETNLTIHIILPNSDSIFVFERTLENAQIGDTIQQTFRVGL